jgi:DNA excision repair protein ERCC-2
MKEYSQEIPVSMELDFEDVILIVSGRIDGVFEYPDMACLEEIKSTRKDPDNIDIPDDHAFWAQVKCYGYLYAHQKGLENITLQLTLCNVDTGKIHEVKNLLQQVNSKHFSKSWWMPVFKKSGP